ncbi:MAG: type III pantothenate kinase [Campylobacteraceae bacterium]|nr:type III pantothenate kinase [Campylobacteraceae bacterium]
MLLCDVGNFSVKLYEDGKVSRLTLEEFAKFRPREEVYYISVNSKFKPKSPNFINIESYFKFDTIYSGLGIDRIAGCYTVENGIVIDAGSAITVDVMVLNTHQGGFIMPGIWSHLKMFKEISPALDIVFNSQIDLECLPQKTADAISFGIVSPIVLAIEHFSKGKKIYFTGGDGSFLAKFFDDAVYDKDLVFRGMKKVLKERGIE